MAPIRYHGADNLQSQQVKVQHKDISEAQNYRVTAHHSYFPDRLGSAPRPTTWLRNKYQFQKKCVQIPRKLGTPLSYHHLDPHFHSIADQSLLLSAFSHEQIYIIFSQDFFHIPSCP